MNGKRFLLGGPIVALCLVIAMGGIAIRARGTTQVKEIDEGVVRTAVDQAKAISVSLLVQDFTGPFTQANIKAQIDAVTSEATKQGIETVWGDTHPVPVVIVPEDPTGKAQVHLQIGLTLPANAEVKAKEPLKVVPIKFEHGIKYVHQGPYARLGDVHQAIHAELQKGGRSAGFPVVLNAIDDPARVPSDQLRTVMLTPVK